VGEIDRHEHAESLPESAFVRRRGARVAEARYARACQHLGIETIAAMLVRQEPQRRPGVEPIPARAKSAAASPRENAGCAARNAATTSSFSSGSTLHVA
jgi:hypothetical protein